MRSHAVVRAGDEVIVLDPCYDCYEPAIDLAGARAVHVALDPRTFAPDWDKVRAAITPAYADADDQQPAQPVRRDADGRRHGAVAGLLRDTGIWLLSDEVYEHIVFDGARHESVLRYPELRERAFVISSFGKTYHCTGWKVGYCIAPPALSAEFRKVHQYNTFCTLRPGAACVRRDDRGRAGTLRAARRVLRGQARPFPRAAADHEAQAAAGSGRVFPAGGLFGGQRPRRSRVLPLADDRAWRRGDSAVAVLRDRRRRAAPGAAVLRQERGDAGCGDRAPATPC